MVSGLNACLCMLEDGYYQEIMVVLRTIDDFFSEYYGIIWRETSLFSYEWHISESPNANLH